MVKQASAAAFAPFEDRSALTFDHSPLWDWAGKEPDWRRSEGAKDLGTHYLCRDLDWLHRPPGDWLNPGEKVLPLYLGIALWSLGLVLKIQGILPSLAGTVALGCAWAASRKEDEFNLEKFGEGYAEYMTMVPAWNALEGLHRALFRGGGTA